ncbi:hypothetical protein PCCS19_06180 [Paenibacillus sp. CCS19]|uniref:ABC transporter permease n=1 Tax=Paenibacillus sp. CCS19 TaxID=3158387 RepID=UPI00256E33DB|nr:ABC transporter permease [Paenibacillus cellulosilyticus]GMK37564.1 hypothetical protein PCCS19_06180 [Paenibacillus cellulosilyticus]
MGLLTMIARKMARNKWLQLNLWFGLTICVALFCSMPLYSNAISQRTFVRELQEVQSQKSVYPGMVEISTTVSSHAMDEATKRKIAEAEAFVKTIPQQMGIEARSFYEQKFTQKMRIYGVTATDEEKRWQNTIGGFRSLTDMKKRVRLIDGRMPSDRQDGIIEALVTQPFLFELKRGMGDELVVESMSDKRQRFRVIPVGIMETDPKADPFLPFRTDEVVDGFMIPEQQFDREFTQGGKATIMNIEWRYAMNFEQLTLEAVDRFVAADHAVRRYFQTGIGVAEVNIPVTDTVASYQGKQQKLEIMMLSLYAPVMLMLAFYLYMAANLIIERQKTEISVLRSRGASRSQIMLVYTLEGLLLGASALALGPLIGIMITKLLGASNGFLSFVQRSALEVSLGSGAYRIAASAVGAAILLILIPALLASRATIVDHKRQMARMTRMSVWHKTGLDIIFVGFAIYLLHTFNKQQEDLKKLALDSSSFQIDPMLFLMPAVFALGAGLLVLRVYPWFVRLIYVAGRRWWSPALYHSLVVISRSSGQYLTIKVFLIMTVATGLFSANAARTINDNMESKIRYASGADVVLMTEWNNDSEGVVAQHSGAAMVGAKRIQYAEPPYQLVQGLAGVESTARVFRRDDAIFFERKSGKGGDATVIGIDTKEFGQTAWMKDGLLHSHINNYLNLISPNPQAVLVSRSIADESGVKPGDAIRLFWNGLPQAQFTVYGIIDYWPSWNPLPSGFATDNNGKPKMPHLVVGHLSTIQKRLATEPYEVWMKLKDGTASEQIYSQLEKRGVPVKSLSDTEQKLVQSMNDPFRLAINGVMTLGFVISMLICFLGFLLFWVLTLSGRTLQYGVLRAMGIPFAQITGMLVSEQVLTSGAAIVIGVLIGNLTSDLYVPLFEMSFSTATQVPPFQIVRTTGDYLHLYAIIGSMMLIGLYILVSRLSRMRIAQALKLGEE